MKSGSEGLCLVHKSDASITECLQTPLLLYCHRMEELFTPDLHQLGSDQGRGNLLGIEPYMIPQDYAVKESFFNKLNHYLLAAQRDQWLNEKTIVVFPEYIGTWLVLAGEGEEVFQAATLESAERAMVFHHPLKFINSWLKSTEKGRAEAAFFRMKANQMAEIYQDVFSQLARDYSVTIVAGSAVLPAPHISSRGLILTEGPLQNVSVIYRPDGTPEPHLIRKSFPTSRELPFTTAVSVSDIPSFETPVGRVGVLICADSWFPQAYITLKTQGIDLLAIPSFDVFGMEKWNQAWRGYDGWQTPTDVDVSDINKITESQAWKKYSLAGRLPSSGAKYGMNVFLRGKLWEQDLGGWPATLVRDSEVFVEDQTQKAAILSLWL
jgi:predicted amidohydrolase